MTKHGIVERDRVGRPTKFSEDMLEQVYNYCLLGATDSQLAGFLQVSEATLNEWKKNKPGFLESMRAGKDEADALVSKSLFHRALGYSHDAVKIVADAKTGAEHKVEYTEHYAPDTKAAIFWLKNRQKSNWRDSSEVEQAGKIIVETRHAGSATDEHDDN